MPRNTSSAPNRLTSPRTRMRDPAPCAAAGSRNSGIVPIPGAPQLSARLQGAILRSTDRGATFQRTPLPFKFGGNEQGRGNGERLAVDPNDGRVLLFGTRADGLWRSDDAGATWREATGFPAIAKARSAWAMGWRELRPVGIAFVVFDPADGAKGTPTRTVYAGVSTNETSLFRSRDGGRSWAPVAGQPTGLRPNHMVRDGRGGFLLSYGDEPGPDSMGNGAVWRWSPDSGQWTDITPAALKAE